MIIRARPRFIGGVEFSRYLSKREVFSEAYNSGFFLGSGRAGLKFLLACYSKYLGRPIKVMLQAFNCTVVRDAVIESGNSYILCDIGLEDFSVRLATLESSEKFDVLLLLHYQGIPNFDYLAIADFCKKKNVLLVEDLAHGDRSTIDGVRVGTLADICIYSYAFDKPVTAMSGGRITLGGSIVNSRFHRLLESYYEALPRESDASSLRDLRLLGFLYRYTDRDHYHLGLNYYGFLRVLTILDWRLLYLFSRMRIFKFFAYAFGALSRAGSISLFRLAPRKIALIQEQEVVLSKMEPLDVSKLECLLSSIGSGHVSRSRNVEIFWNRYSLLDSGKVKKVLQSMGVEAGNFNWPALLCRESEVDFFPNAKYAAQKIVNIPVWTEIVEVDD